MPTLRLPWPPSLNNLYASVGKRRVLSQRGRDFHTRVAEEVMVQWPRTVPRPLCRRLEITMTLYAPTRQAYDIDGKIKIVWDALQKAGVMTNDSQIDVLHLSRGPVEGKPGHITVEIEEINGIVREPHGVSHREG